MGFLEGFWRLIFSCSLAHGLSSTKLVLSAALVVWVTTPKIYTPAGYIQISYHSSLGQAPRDETIHDILPRGASQVCLGM